MDAHTGGGLTGVKHEDKHHNPDPTWEQEERPAIVPRPVAVFSLEVAVEVHTFQRCVYGRVSSRRAGHKLTLEADSLIID